MNRKQFYAQITESILQKLEEGIVPWKKGWSAGIPQNFISRRVYRGVNFISLLSKDFPSPYYLSYLQCKKKNGRILPGAKGIPIIYFSVEERTVDPEGKCEVERLPLMRISHIFNLSQTTLYEDESPKLRLPSCEEVLSNILNRHSVDIRENHYRCYYSAKEDYISLPKIADFKSGAEEYYSSLYHEIIHWTGHKSRLNRISSLSDISDLSLEELTAEIGSSFLAGMSGIIKTTFENQNAYIRSWYSKIREDPQILFTAAAKASEAVEFLLEQNESSFGFELKTGNLPGSLYIITLLFLKTFTP